VSFSPGYRRYVLGSLTLVYTLNSLDVALMILVLEPIKRELHVSDSQLGVVTGIAFGLFYSTLGVPFARWVDRGNRVRITSVAIGLWAVTVMSCFFVSNFIQLVAARLAAGIGESGVLPATYSLLGDYFREPAERTRAMTVYMLANPLSPLIGFIVGGYLLEHVGWRMAFVAIGAPGLVAALLFRWTIVEPRTAAGQRRSHQSTSPPLSSVLKTLWRQRTSRHLMFAIILILTMGFGISPWYAAFMMRSHAMEAGQLGLWFGLIFGLGGCTGTLLGGYVASRWFVGDERGQLRANAWVVGSQLPLYALFLFVPSGKGALLALFPLMVAFNYFYGPTYALLQRLIGDEMRATGLMVVMLLANLIGLGVGPQLIGVMSDLLGSALGMDSLRYAIFVLSFVALWAASQLWAASRTVKADLAAVAQAADSRAESVGERMLPSYE